MENHIPDNVRLVGAVIASFTAYVLFLAAGPPLLAKTLAVRHWTERRARLSMGAWALITWTLYIAVLRAVAGADHHAVSVLCYVVGLCALVVLSQASYPVLSARMRGYALEGQARVRLVQSTAVCMAVISLAQAGLYSSAAVTVVELRRHIAHPRPRMTMHLPTAAVAAVAGEWT